MHTFTFELNNQPMSDLKMGVFSFPAFSGRSSHTNRRISACHVGFGPIPPGTYYIFDRQTGDGLAGALRELMEVLEGKHDWFALYAIDGKIDDETYCNRVRRGEFRLHPKGPQGISQGCITIDSRRDYARLRGILKNTAPMEVPGMTLLAYGKVVVR